MKIRKWNQVKKQLSFLMAGAMVVGGCTIIPAEDAKDDSNGGSVIANFD